MMRNSDEKLLMWEAATLYYEKKYTQQEIAGLLELSRQTVSKLLSDAVKENIVEIKLHDPRKSCAELEVLLCQRFGLSSASVCSVSSRKDSLRQLMTVRSATAYIAPLLQQGGLKVAVSWGRTIQDMIRQMPEMHCKDTLVFPLFGATDVEDICFSSNEIARSLSDKTGAGAQYAWFPYLTESEQDYQLLKKTGYYKKIKALWEQIDLALVGIGNTEIVSLFGNIIGCPAQTDAIVGDVATHFFDINGSFAPSYPNKLCASIEHIKHAKTTIAIACGSEKTQAIVGALRTGLLNVLITDEHTARQILEYETA